VCQAIKEATGVGHCQAQVRPATDVKFGDYQSNAVMSLAKRLKMQPRALAEKIVRKLEVDEFCAQMEVAGPGFINFRLKKEFVGSRLLEIYKDGERLGIDKTRKPETIVVDFSGPNIAKEMHVGHLRSTIIGDCICSMLDFLGHSVIPQNHIGDWGTQFGMLCHYFVSHYVRPELRKRPDSTHFVLPDGELHISDMEEFYKEAKKCFDTDEDFARNSRDYVVKLQSGDEHALSLWRYIVSQSMMHCKEIYDFLDIKLSLDDTRGESSYNSDLSNVVSELKKKNLAVESEGAVCVFPPGFKNKDGTALPLIIQKSDGAYLYATTDLAAIRFRVNQLKADRIIYVTDARQKLHFEMVFKAAEMAGWVDNTELVHVTFGAMLGEDGRPFKTRAGKNVKLKALLTEAVQRARDIVEQKNPHLPPKAKDLIAQSVGIGAVKYADYSNNRSSDYVFSFDKMLAMNGNTAPYMQYAYARVNSIEKKAQSAKGDIFGRLSSLDELSLEEPQELELAKKLIGYPEAINSSAREYRCNYLTTYLYELAQKFSIFYTKSPVIKAPDDKRPGRVLLCDLTRKTIAHGLKRILHIDIPKQM